MLTRVLLMVVSLCGFCQQGAEHANVYVQGLPLDITMEEMKDTFKSTVPPLSLPC